LKYRGNSRNFRDTCRGRNNFTSGSIRFLERNRHHDAAHFGTIIRAAFYNICRSTKHEITNTYKILVGKPEGKRPLGRPRRRWEGNIRMDIRENGRESVD
jgi:hypothetical protein